MRRSAAVAAGVIAGAWLTAGAPASAQDPAATPKVWTVQASAGLALTSGNTDTSTVNAAYELTYDPVTAHVVKSDGLWIRGKTDGQLTANRLGLNIRDEFRINGRMFVFGQNQYFRDEFKRIEYLLAPAAGFGYAPFDSDRTKLSFDAGLGGVWEKNPDAAVRTSGSLTVSEKLTRVLTSTTTLTQSFSGLWKTKDFEDALFTAGLGLAVSMSTRTQLKIELLDTFKNKPSVPGVEQNDLAMLMAISYKI